MDVLNTMSIVNMHGSDRNQLLFLTFHANWIASSPIPTRMTCSVLITNNMISTVTLIMQSNISSYFIASTTVP